MKRRENDVFYDRFHSGCCTPLIGIPSCCNGMPAGGAVQLRVAERLRQRSVVERVNTRLDGGLGFDRPAIRALATVQPRVTMAPTIMLAMAIGRIRARQPERLRSLFRPA